VRVGRTSQLPILIAFQRKLCEDSDVFAMAVGVASVGDRCCGLGDQCAEQVGAPNVSGALS
jgi:hypothetical protein